MCVSLRFGFRRREETTTFPRANCHGHSVSGRGALKGRGRRNGRTTVIYAISRGGPSPVDRRSHVSVPVSRPSARDALTYITDARVTLLRGYPCSARAGNGLSRSRKAGAFSRTSVRGKRTRTATTGRPANGFGTRTSPDRVNVSDFTDDATIATSTDARER